MLSSDGCIVEEVIAEDGEVEELIAIGTSSEPFVDAEVTQGFPPRSPTSSIRDEAAHIIFDRLWESIVVPALMRVIQPPVDERDKRATHGGKKRSKSHEKRESSIEFRQKIPKQDVGFPDTDGTLVERLPSIQGHRAPYELRRARTANTVRSSEK
jgi:hypothetical protein